MLQKLSSMLLMGLFLVACGSGDTSGPGGAGGAGGTSNGGSGGATSSSASSTETGGGTTSGTSGTTSETAGCDAPPENVYENASAVAVAEGCSDVAPAPGEDGTFAVTVFGPFGKPFQVESFTFAASESPATGVTDPWLASVIVVPVGGDPTTIDPNMGAKLYPLTLLESTSAGAQKTNLYSVQLDAPLSVGACEQVVVSLRNSEGPPLTGILMCGPPSEHKETNRWWNLDGTTTAMVDFSAQFDRDWRVSLVPVTP